MGRYAPDSSMFSRDPGKECQILCGLYYVGLWTWIVDPPDQKRMTTADRRRGGGFGSEQREKATKSSGKIARMTLFLADENDAHKRIFGPVMYKQFLAGVPVTVSASSHKVVVLHVLRMLRADRTRCHDIEGLEGVKPRSDTGLDSWGYLW